MLLKCRKSKKLGWRHSTVYIVNMTQLQQPLDYDSLQMAWRCGRHADICFLSSTCNAGTHWVHVQVHQWCGCAPTDFSWVHQRPRCSDSPSVDTFIRLQSYSCKCARTRSRMSTVAVLDLGVFIDADLSVKTHVTKTVSACFAMLPSSEVSVDR